MSLSSHPEVLKVVQGQTFVQAVRLSCTILKDVSLTDEVIRRAALTQAYPRIALILATTVDKDSNSIIPAGSITYEVLYKEVERLAISQPYVDDIHRVAAALTASYFIKSTPLNSSIQLLPLGDHMEKQAIEDLDRLRGLVLHHINTLLVEGASTPIPSTPTFYFSGLVVDGRSSDDIFIPNDTRGVAVYTLTTYQPVPLEVAVEVPDTIPELVLVLSEAINNLSIKGGGNILSSPNRGGYVIASPECVPGGALVRLDYVTLAPRRLDPLITRELAILNFYLIPDTAPISNWRGHVLETSIPSLLYGVVGNYKELHPSGPHSLLLEVEKGVIAKAPDKKDVVDTLYLEGDADGLIEYSVSINGQAVTGEVLISSESGSTSMQVAESLRGVVGSNALIAQVRPDAIQVIPNGSTNVGVGITSLPQGVTGSVGTSLASLYPYVNGPIALTINPNSNMSIRRPTLAEEATGVYAAASVKFQTSPRMQAVYDQLDRLNRLRGGRCGW